MPSRRRLRAERQNAAVWLARPASRLRLWFRLAVVVLNQADGNPGNGPERDAGTGSQGKTLQPVDQDSNQDGTGDGRDHSHNASRAACEVT